MIGTKIAEGVPCKSCGVLVYRQTRNTRPNETGLCRTCWRKSKRGVNSSWYRNGTYINQQGYKLVRIYEEDFFYPMADGNGYVREHRLVMAKHLGRCLESWESVHHKDGDKLNNELPNLELLNKNQHMRDHNKGYKDGFEKGLIDGRKESLKKVVEYIRQHQWQGHKSVDFDSPRGYMISEDDMQSLLDEVKDV